LHAEINVLKFENSKMHACINSLKTNAEKSHEDFVHKINDYLMIASNLENKLNQVKDDCKF
jgi:hypothetical protein